MWFLWSCRIHLGHWQAPRCVHVCSVFIGSAKFSSVAGKSHFNRLRKVSSGRVGECEAVPGTFQVLWEGVSSVDLLVWNCGVSFNLDCFQGEQIEDFSRCVGLSEGEKSDASCCSRREVNQQGPWFPSNSNYCLFLRSSNPTTTLVKSELQGQTHRRAREQTKPVLVHRTPILY